MMRVALAQIDLVVGDVEGNTQKILDAVGRAEREGAHVVALPELAVTGYPPEDLLHRQGFIEANEAALAKIAAATGDVIAVVGFVEAADDHLYNAAAVCSQGETKAIYRKHMLPNYGVFDEDRYFEPGDRHFLFDTGRELFGVCICEDVWVEDGPVTVQGKAGATVVININASPFHKGKVAEREALIRDRAQRGDTAVVYLNSIGGQDELVFDGASFAIGRDGSLLARLPQFEEDFVIVDIPTDTKAQVPQPHTDVVELPSRFVEGNATATIVEPLEGPAEVYRSLALALRDYARKNGFTKMVVGLSGGVDSALTAVIGADALGPGAVLGILMPSPFSSEHSVTDARALADNLGIRHHTIPIAGIYERYLETLEQVYGPQEMGLAEENIQARIRGNLLMAISNRYGHLVVATGNKSEMAVGYSTLYGDMAGGFALLKDVFKTEVYELCRYRNSISPVIPDNVLSKPPSAELRPDQRDQDSLPPYEVLDAILDLYIEGDQGRRQIVEAGYERELVDTVIRMVDRAEYKRRQAPPGPKVTTKAFGRDRRLPLTNHWREG